MWKIYKLNVSLIWYIPLLNFLNGWCVSLSICTLCNISDLLWTINTLVNILKKNVTSKEFITDGVFGVDLQHASPYWGQDGGTDGSCEGHPGGRSAVECHWVALVCWAALDGGLVGEAQQGVVCGHVAAGGVFLAALIVEADEVWQRWESWGDTMELDWYYW